MASVLAIVSKKVFEHDFGGAGVGEVVATERYASSHKTLDKLAEGGDLFLVTVAANEQLLLAGVLRAPKFGGGGWSAKPNSVAVKDITALVGKLKFDTGHGITAKAGALAMSLQTPRGMTDEDVALIDGAKAEKPAKAATPAKPAKPAKTAKPAKPAKTPSKIATVAGADSDLARVESDLDAKQLVAALDGLLRAWQRCRSKEVADAIDRLGAAIGRSLPPILGNKKTIDAAWRDVGDQLRPADVPRLLIALDQGSAPQAEGWLDILLRFPIDPRMSEPALDMSMKFVSSTAGPTRTRAFKLAEIVADGRCLPHIVKLKSSQRGAWNSTELRERLTKTASKIAPPPKLPAADATTVKAINAAIAKVAKQPPVPEAQLFVGGVAKQDDGDRLLAEVLADPHNDANRLIYSDYLQDRGDPRGELMVLQSQSTLDKDQEARVRALVRDPHNLKAWLGPLIAVVSDPVFDRGFLTGCKVVFKTAKQRADLPAHPLWATVEDLWCDELALVESPTMRSLERVSGLSLASLAELAKRKQPVPFHSLVLPQFDDVADDKPTWVKILASPAFAKLRHFGPFLRDFRVIEELGEAPAGWLWILDSPCGKHLTSFAAYLDDEPPLGPWFELFEARKHLERLEIMAGSSASIVYAFERDRFVMTLDHPASLGERDLTPALLAGITGVPELVVVLDGNPKKPVRERITALATSVYGKQFKRVTVR